MSEHVLTALPNTRVSGSKGLLWQNRGHDDDFTMQIKRTQKGDKIQYFQLTLIGLQANTSIQKV